MSATFVTSASRGETHLNPEGKAKAAPDQRRAPTPCLSLPSVESFSRECSRISEHWELSGWKGSAAGQGRWEGKVPTTVLYSQKGKFVSAFG